MNQASTQQQPTTSPLNSSDTMPSLEQDSSAVATPNQTHQQSTMPSLPEHSAPAPAPIPDSVDDEIEQMKRRIAEMEAEERRTAQLQSKLAEQQQDSQQQHQQQQGLGRPSYSSSSGQPGYQPSSSSAAASSSQQSSIVPASTPESDARSVYIGNVDYSCTVDELHKLFSACGTVNRVTILNDKFTGKPKGFAYCEFSEQAGTDSVQNALLLNDTEFKGRQLKVTEKRTNVPAFQLAQGRGGRGARGARGGFDASRGRGRGRGAFAGGFDPSRGRGRGAGAQRFGNARGVYAPY